MPLRVIPFTTLSDAARRVLRGLTKPGEEAHDTDQQEATRIRSDEPGEADGDRPQGRIERAKRQAVVRQGPWTGGHRRPEGRGSLAGRRAAEREPRLICGRTIEWFACEALSLAAMAAFCWALVRLADHLQPGAFP